MNPSGELDLIRRILEKVGTSLSSHKILGFALEGIKDSFRCLAAAIILVDARAETFKVVTAKGWGYEFLKRFHLSPFKGLVREMAGSWKPIIITAQDRRRGSDGYVFQHDYRTLLALPMAVRGKPVGMLYLSWGEDFQLTEEIQSILMDLANLCTLILDQSSLDEKVFALSNIDPLTGLYSYKFWHEELHREITRAEKLNTRISLMLVNLNRFREFNAMYGHVKGDELLVEVSQVIQNELDTLDVPCRVGGKWNILIVGEEEGAVKGIADRIIRAYDDLPVTGSALTNLSLGISMYQPGEGEKSVIERAEDALREARRRGGNSWHFR